MGKSLGSEVRKRLPRALSRTPPHTHTHTYEGAWTWGSAWLVAKKDWVYK